MQHQVAPWSTIGVVAVAMVAFVVLVRSGRHVVLRTMGMTGALTCALALFAAAYERIAGPTVDGTGQPSRSLERDRR